MEHFWHIVIAASGAPILLAFALRFALRGK